MMLLPVTVIRNILGHLNEVWILLEELMPERMKRYGSMSVTDEAYRGSLC